MTYWQLFQVLKALGCTDQPEQFPRRTRVRWSIDVTSSSTSCVFVDVWNRKDEFSDTAFHLLHPTDLTTVIQQLTALGHPPAFSP